MVKQAALWIQQYNHPRTILALRVPVTALQGRPRRLEWDDGNGVGRDPLGNGATHQLADRHPRSEPASLSLAMGGTTPGTHAELDARSNVLYGLGGISQCSLHASAIHRSMPDASPRMCPS